MANFEAPFGSRCRNGKLLSEGFIQSHCAQPSAESVWRGRGEYYNFCTSGVKTKARWLDQACEEQDSAALYPHSGQFYSICPDQLKVHAQWYQNYCRTLPDKDKYTDSGAFAKPCLKEHKLREETLEELTRIARMQNPLAVVWPPDGAMNIKPTFYSEDPHPTPDKVVTGYPVSIQFNPALVDTAVINQFSLERKTLDSLGDPSWELVTDLRPINANNDIHNLFTDLQFAWFAESRLQWNSEYRATISAQLDGVQHLFSATFTTQHLEGRIAQVGLDTEKISIEQEHFYLYQLPSALEPEPFKDIQFSARKFVNIQVDVIDPSTIEVWLSRTACLPVKLLFSSGRKLQISPCF